MTKDNLITAPVGTTLEQAQEILRKNKIEKLPIVDDNGILKGLITIKDIEKSVKFPNSARDARGRLLCGAGIGVTANMLERAKALIDAQVDVLVLDSAHGHSANIINALKKLKAEFPDTCYCRKYRYCRSCRRTHSGRCGLPESRNRPRFYLYYQSSSRYRCTADYCCL